jgi:hypothetical protein
VELLQEIAETMRKTGVALVLATQLPQMGSLGGSIRLRDALVAGNCLVLRASNRGSGPSILPDDFVGDPYNIKPEDEKGRPTAGMGYLRTTFKVGMIGRVPKLDETAAAAAAPRIDVVWQVGPVDPASPIVLASATTTSTAGSTAVAGSTGSTADGSANKWRTILGVGRGKPAAPAAPANSTEWIVACLRAGPASAQALLDRPDCPVGKSRLYDLLKDLTDRGVIVAPDRNNGPYRLPAAVGAGR